MEILKKRMDEDIIPFYRMGIGDKPWRRKRKYMRNPNSRRSV
jgi:hypothetical protein